VGVCAGLRHASELGFEAVSLSEALDGDPVVDIFDEDLSIFDAIGQGCVSVSRFKAFDEDDLKPFQGFDQGCAVVSMRGRGNGQEVGEDGEKGSDGLHGNLRVGVIASKRAIVVG